MNNKIKLVKMCVLLMELKMYIINIIGSQTDFIMLSWRLLKCVGSILSLKAGGFGCVGPTYQFLGATCPFLAVQMGNFTTWHVLFGFYVNHATVVNVSYHARITVNV